MNQQALLTLLASGDCWAVDRLCQQLGLTATELAAAAEALQDQGVALENDGRGYRVNEPLILLDREKILAALSPSLTQSLACFQLTLAIDSTSSSAMRWLQSGAGGHGLFLAEKQEQGRGRRGRNWVSPLARNIYMSLAWPVSGVQAATEGFSLVVALSLVEGLQALALAGSDRLQVKWPNDVWLGNAKLAGILLEFHRGRAGGDHVVVGMGVNVDLPGAARQGIDQAVTDLRSQGNVGVDRNRIVASVLNRLELNLARLGDQGFEPFRQHWSRLDALHNRQVEVRGSSEPLAGVVSGVGPTGQLLLQTGEGERAISGGEIAPSVRVLEPLR